MDHKRSRVELETQPMRWHAESNHVDFEHRIPYVGRPSCTGVHHAQITPRVAFMYGSHCMQLDLVAAVKLGQINDSAWCHAGSG